MCLNAVRVCPSSTDRSLLQTNTCKLVKTFNCMWEHYIFSQTSHKDAHSYLAEIHVRFLHTHTHAHFRFHLPMFASIKGS